MYFKITKSLLQTWSKPDLIDLFEYLGVDCRQPKTALIDSIYRACSHDRKLGQCTTWRRICPYCRGQSFLCASSTLRNPRFCMSCGKTSPLYALESSLDRTSQLVILASKMNRKAELSTKEVLLDQSLVTVITALEVLMREVYALIYDHQHVVLGKPVFGDIYARTRNEFLNLGSASKWLSKVTSLKLKESLSEGDYKFLSSMYSARHIIVHNSSTKDKDYLSQTGEPESELNKRLKLRVPDIQNLIRISKSLAGAIDQELRDAILDFQQEQLSLVRNIRDYYHKKSSRTKGCRVPVTKCRAL